MDVVKRNKDALQQNKDALQRVFADRLKHTEKLQTLEQKGADTTADRALWEIAFNHYWEAYAAIHIWETAPGGKFRDSTTV